MDSHFKGWAKPGPIAPGAASSDAPASGETLDAISGHFRIYQLRDGHRFSTDDVLTAWYGTTWAPSAHAVLDPATTTPARQMELLAAELDALAQPPRYARPRGESR